MMEQRFKSRQMSQMAELFDNKLDNFKNEVFHLMEEF